MQNRQNDQALLGTEKDKQRQQNNEEDEHVEAIHEKNRSRLWYSRTGKRNETGILQQKPTSRSQRQAPGWDYPSDASLFLWYYHPAASAPSNHHRSRPAVGDEMKVIRGVHLALILAENLGRQVRQDL